MNALSYFLIASLYLLLFYSCYRLLLRRNTFFGLNRAYLLASVALSVTLPLVELPSGTADNLPVSSFTLPTFVIGAAPATSADLTADQWFWLVYGLGVVVMLVRLGLHLLGVSRLIKRGTTEHKPGFTLVRLPDEPAPGTRTPSFSFGRYLVLNYVDACTEPDALLRHEEAHIRQYHTADVLFLTLAQAAFWFNPLLWFYKRDLQEIHEFLADQAACRRSATQPVATYARQLVAYALDVPVTALTTPFVSKSTLKQRIIMLQKPASNRRALLSYALVLPLAALLAMCTQSEPDQPLSETALSSSQASARKGVNVDGAVFTVVEQSPEFPTGMAGLGAFLQKNLHYPAAANKANVEGRVFVSFIVTKTGEITDVTILKGIGYGADEEAVRVVQSMPRWKPARQAGQVVNVKYNLPINFQLEEKKTTEPTSAFKGITHFIIDGKEVTEQDITTLAPDKIERMDVNKEKGEISITTK